jgi:hypothetical protein
MRSSVAFVAYFFASNSRSLYMIDVSFCNRTASALISDNELHVACLRCVIYTDLAGLVQLNLWSLVIGTMNR